MASHIRFQDKRTDPPQTFATNPVANSRARVWPITGIDLKTPAFDPIRFLRPNNVSQKASFHRNVYANR